jgi:hypothetical protein
MAVAGASDVPREIVRIPIDALLVAQGFAGARNRFGTSVRRADAHAIGTAAPTVGDGLLPVTKCDLPFSVEANGLLTSMGPPDGWTLEALRKLLLA